MGVFVDLSKSKRKYGSLRPVRRVFKTKGRTHWFCECDCGGTTTVEAGELKALRTVTCGCGKKTGDHGRKHGYVGTRTYRCWSNAKNRCTNKNNPRYADYGGRGIKFCQRWNEFSKFLEDMGECPLGETLEREENDGDYSPGNCRWLPQRLQNRNKRNVKKYRYVGRSLTMPEWSDLLGMPLKVLRWRINNGWSIKRALEQPLRVPKSLSEDERRQRLRARWSLNQAVVNGTVVKPARCQAPGCTVAEVQAHHHKGYDREHYWDVLWLCRRHHNLADLTA